MVGSPALVDGSWSAFRTVVQLPGRAVFLPRREARRLVELSHASQVLFRYELLLLREASVTAACNRAHRTRPRLARWLLLIADRAERDAFPLTHESLSAMLGVRRESISLAANELRDSGAIEYRRATIAVTDRTTLGKQACSCYEVITDDYARFLDHLVE
jgi:CRP-like cAMP-binding protein